MIHEVAARSAITSLTSHLIRWISNLSRGGTKRKQESRASLKRVILAVRKTAIYCRSLDEGAPKDYAREAAISVEWTDLGLELERLGLHKLAKKCRVKGWYWENQDRFDDDFLEKAGVRFDQVERVAMQLLTEIEDRK